MSDAGKLDAWQPVRRAGAVAARWASTKPAKLAAIRFVTAGVVALTLSEVLSRFSGTSLLFPDSWREIVLFVASIAGIMCFEAGYRFRQEAFRRRRRARPADPAGGEPANNEKDDEKAEEEEEAPAAVIRASWIVLTLLFCSVSVFLLLRTCCLYPFDPAPWLATQVAAERDSVNRTAASVTRPAETEPSGTGSAQIGVAKIGLANVGFAKVGFANAEPATTKPVETDEEIARRLTPDFVNAEQKLICIPLWLPRDDEKYVQYMVKSRRNNDGMQVLLTDQPGLVIDWLQGDAKFAETCTTWIFMLNYLACVACSLLVLGLRFNLVESIWESVFKV